MLDTNHSDMWSVRRIEGVCEKNEGAVSANLNKRMLDKESGGFSEAVLYLCCTTWSSA